MDPMTIQAKQSHETLPLTDSHFSGWNIFLSYQNNINNRRLAAANALLLAAEEDARAINLDPAVILVESDKKAVVGINNLPEEMSATALQKAKVEKEVRQAEKLVEEAQKRRKELRDEEGGGALGVGTRMGWS